MKECPACEKFNNVEFPFTITPGELKHIIEVSLVLRAMGLPSPVNASFGAKLAAISHTMAEARPECEDITTTE